MSEEKKTNNVIIAMPPPPKQGDTQMAIELPSEKNTRAETESRMEEETATFKEEPTKRNKYHFADKVVVNGETILEISDDKVFYEEEKVRRSTRWTDPKTKKSKYPD